MDIKKALLFLLVALMLLANCSAATKCMVFVVDEYKMTINNAEIYFDEKNKCLMAVDATYESCRVTLPESLTDELRAKIDD